MTSIQHKYSGNKSMSHFRGIDTSVCACGTNHPQMFFCLWGTVVGFGDVRWIKYRSRWGEDMQSKPGSHPASARFEVCARGPGCSQWWVTYSAGKENVDASATRHVRTLVSWTGSCACVASRAKRSSTGRGWSHTPRALKAKVTFWVRP